MNKLTKVGISLLYAVIALFVLATYARADITILSLPSGPNALPDMIRAVINMLLYLLGFIAILFLIIGGYQYIASSGNPDQIETAKKTIMYAVIGIVVVVLSWAIIYFVTSSLGGGIPSR